MVKEIMNLFFQYITWELLRLVSMQQLLNGAELLQGLFSLF